MKTKNKHWDSIFSNSEDSSLGWYEKDLTETLTLLGKIEKWEKSTIFISGAGTSSLINILHSKKIPLIVNDISLEAINKVKARLGTSEEKIDWLCQDISQPFYKKIAPIDIWLDRAVLHFLTEEENIKGYFENLKKYLAPNGYVIFAEFSKKGVTKCAGLPIHQYCEEELSKKLGETFKLISHFEHVYINPQGDEKPYIYTLYQRVIF